MKSNTKGGMIIGKPALDFTLQDHQGGFVTLTKMTKISPAMLGVSRTYRILFYKPLIILNFFFREKFA